VPTTFHTMELLIRCYSYKLHVDKSNLLQLLVTFCGHPM